MSPSQMVFDRLFAGQYYTSRGDFEARDWQMENADYYNASVERWHEKHPDPRARPQHRYTIYGGPGSGKTKAVGLLICHLLNLKLIRQVVVVCPNRSIRRKTAADFKKCFNVHLVPFHSRRHAEGITLMTKQGYILTYAHLIKNPELHAIITREDTLVVFDEVHHLGRDNSAWGDAALKAYGHVPYVINLTGTPYRSDNSPIPFVEYEATDSEGIRRFRADFTYSLGQAVFEGICRKPIFIFRDEENTRVQIRYGVASGEITVSFADDKIPDPVSAARLRGAVQARSVPRLEMLRDALAICRRQQRKVIIFLGGDSDSDHTPTMDATTLLPDELRKLGYGPEDYEIVTGDDEEAQVKIENFGPSSKWILISINMVSEGTDIPELSAAIFLTTVTTKQTTVQRIGRALRFMGPSDPHVEALIFMFPDPSNLALAKETEGEILVEENRLKRKRDSAPEGSSEESKRHRVEAIGIEDGGMGTVYFNGEHYPYEVWSQTQQDLRTRGLPITYFAVGMALTLGVANGHSRTGT